MGAGTWMGTRIAVVGIGMGSMQPCKGGEKLEVLNVIDQTSNPGEDPTSCKGKINKIAGSKKKIEQAFSGSWIPTANHKITFID